MTASPRGRYAPSPTGELHLGNASTALLAWASVRARGGAFVMRVEDLDRNRSKPEWREQGLEDLRWLGLDWDEGPGAAEPHPPYLQSERDPAYAAALVELERAGRLYPCFCSRRDIASAAAAPQEPGDEVRYPGTCRRLDPARAAARVAAGEPHALRFRVGAEEAEPAFGDLVRGRCGGGPPPGDFVVRRRDGMAAYQLAVVVDDDAMAIDEVVRGDDLLPSTGRQLLLFAALGRPAPRFGHVPLLLGADGVRLSKRHRGVTLRELREAGWSAPALVGRLAATLGLRPTAEPFPAAALARDFDLGRLPRADAGLRVDPDRW